MKKCEFCRFLLHRCITTHGSKNVIRQKKIKIKQFDAKGSVPNHAKTLKYAKAV